MLCNGQTLNIFLLSKIGILNLQGCKSIIQHNFIKNKDYKILYIYYFFPDKYTHKYKYYINPIIFNFCSLYILNKSNYTNYTNYTNYYTYYTKYRILLDKCITFINRCYHKKIIVIPYISSYKNKIDKQEKILIKKIKKIIN
uniref:Uncharacterized protein n=1 Tax=viral metagenome TaxID=1070528 RepID=A0A6C0H7R9_9ZZZZ